MGALVAVICILSLKPLGDAGLRLKKRITDADTGARAEQAVAAALQTLPDDYYVFHDLEFPGFNIDHVVLGPNGIFLVETKSQKGNITQEHGALLRNGRKFFKDFLKQCWRQSHSLRDHLGADNLGGVSITPILCFSRGFVEIRGPVRGVAVLNIGYLRPFILSQRGSISAQSINNVITALAATVSTHATDHSLTDCQSSTDGIICPKCVHERTGNDDQFCSNGECPNCGVSYDLARTDTTCAPSTGRPAGTGGRHTAPATQLPFLTNRSPFTQMADLALSKGRPASSLFSWKALALKLAFCAISAALVSSAYKTIRVNVTNIFSPVQSIQAKEASPPPNAPAAFPLTHAVLSDNSSKTMTFIFDEDRGQNLILLFFNNQTKALTLRACVRANERLTTTLPRVDLGFLIVTGREWHGYKELFGPQSLARKALMTLSSQVQTGSVSTVRGTSGSFLHKSVSSPIAEAKAWVHSAFLMAD